MTELEPVAGWVTVRVEDTCDGLLINADDMKRFGLREDHQYQGHFLPDGRYRIAVPVTLSSAQSAIEEREARIAELEAENAQAVSYCLHLANTMNKRFYHDVSPEFQPFPDIVGLLTQVDNMVAGIGARAEAAGALLKEAMRAMDRCVHDGGFDRESGPIGCSLGDKCVCIGVYPILARSPMSKIGERNGE